MFSIVQLIHNKSKTSPLGIRGPDEGLRDPSSILHVEARFPRRLPLRLGGCDGEGADVGLGELLLLRCAPEGVGDAGPPARGVSPLHEAARGFDGRRLRRWVRKKAHPAVFPFVHLMSQKGLGRVACSRILGASGRARGYTQPFQTLSKLQFFFAIIRFCWQLMLYCNFRPRIKRRPNALLAAPQSARRGRRRYVVLVPVSVLLLRPPRLPRRALLNGPLGCLTIRHHSAAANFKVQLL